MPVTAIDDGPAPGLFAVPPVRWRQQLLATRMEEEAAAACNASSSSMARAAAQGAARGRKHNLSTLRAAEQRASADFFWEECQEPQNLPLSTAATPEQRDPAAGSPAVEKQQQQLPAEKKLQPREDSVHTAAAPAEKWEPKPPSVRRPQSQGRRPARLHQRPEACKIQTMRPPSSGPCTSLRNGLSSRLGAGRRPL
eukprot:TRINITY_DN42057_c0_g1_i1.p1 TRINITY_DN42057_c0_g1~~TRINITY_DN42057_c0_g1_i1.p1  ORF type:complete len:196 (-),score=45.38 TRINITY_DN42057_c0_g1_i1:33-620(-)